MCQFQMTNRARVYCIAGILMATTACGRSYGAPTERRFVCNKFGFTMLVPRGWSVKTIGVLPMFFSFDPGDSIPVIHLPEGGATINMEIESEAPRADSSLQWLRTLRGYATAIAKAGGPRTRCCSPSSFQLRLGPLKPLWQAGTFRCGHRKLTIPSWSAGSSG